MTFNNPVKGSWLNVVLSFITKKYTPLKKKKKTEIKPLSQIKNVIIV